MIAGALTAGELATLRANLQGCDLFLAVLNPVEVWSAEVTAAPASPDCVYQIDFNLPVGVVTDIKAGMTLWVGSTPGAYDIGQARVRTDPVLGDTHLDIGETSEILWANGQHLTVVNEFALWPRTLYIDGAGTVFMDRDIAYTNQHTNCNPVVVMGSHACLWLTGASVAVSYDASYSWVIGSAIVGYAWTCPGAAIAGGAGATPTLTFTSAGTYLLTVTVTAANGKTSIGRRYIFVFDAANMPATVFQLDSCGGDWQSGGWNFSVTAWAESTLALVRDRALCVLFARDTYGATETSIGPIAGSENIIAAGWISGDSIVWSPNVAGTVSFDVHGPAWWMGNMPGFPAGIEDHAGAATAWTEFDDLTIRKGLFHFLYWRTTAPVVIDCTLTTDTRQVAVFDAPVGSLWEQINSQSDNAIMARPLCDRYGRMFCEIDSQFLPVASRVAIPIVQDFLTSDWLDEIDLERREAKEAAQVDLSGVFYLNGAATPLFSLSPGHVFGRVGRLERRERLALSSQAQSNELCGLYCGYLNNVYPDMGIRLPNHRAFDLCPNQYGRISIASGDTPRGMTLTDVKIIPRRIDYRHDAARGTLSAEISFEAETFPTHACAGDPPPTPPAPPPPVPPTPIPIVPPVEAWYVFAATAFGIGRSTNFLDTSIPAIWEDVTPAAAELGLTVAHGWTRVQCFDVLYDGQAVVGVLGDAPWGGLYYCANIFAASPSWALIADRATITAEAIATSGCLPAGCDYLPLAVKFDDAGVCWCPVYGTPNGSPWGVVVWFTIAGGARTPCQAVGMPGAGVNLGLLSSTWNVGGNSGAMMIGLGETFVGGGVVYDMVNNMWYQGAPGVSGPARVHQIIDDAYCLDADAPTPPDDVWANTSLASPSILSDVFGTLRVINTSAGFLHVKNTGQDLYMNASLLALDTAVFGAGCEASNMELVYNNISEIIWTNRRNGTSKICYSPDGGSTWYDRLGNWVAVLGAWDDTVTYPIARAV